MRLRTTVVAERCSARGNRRASQTGGGGSAHVVFSSRDTTPKVRKVERRRPVTRAVRASDDIKQRFIGCSTDWAMTADAPTDKTAWAAYRQALRDFPATWVPSEEADFPEPPVVG